MNCKTLGLLCSVFCASLWAATEITDGNLTAKFDNGSFKIYCGKDQNPAMTLTPDPAIENAYADTAVPRKDRKALIMRGTSGSVAVILCDRSLQVTGSSGIKSLNASMKAEAVVLCDTLAEDDVIVPQKKALRVPNFLTFFKVLVNDSDLIVNCVKSARPSDVTFRKDGDKTVFSFPQSNGENMIFTFLTGKGVWRKFSGLTDEFQKTGWQPPFPACFAASFDCKGNRISFPLVENGNLAYNWRVGMDFVTVGNINKHEPPTLWTSNTGWISYPFFKEKDGTVLLRLPSKGKIKAGDYSPDNVYVYAHGAIIRGHKNAPDTPADQVFPNANPIWQPQKYLPLYARGPFANSRTFVFPPTCASTNKVEEAFVKGTVKKDAAVLRDQLNRMDLFAAGIRARIEQYMRWSEDMRTILAELPNYDTEYAPVLEGFRKIYDSFAPKMKHVNECLALSLEMRKLIDAAGDEEELEEKAKTLGRAIREIGGAQDSCLGNMRSQAKIIRAKLLKSYVNGTPDKLLDWKISAMFDDMDRLFNGYIGMEGK